MKRRLYCLFLLSVILCLTAIGQTEVYRLHGSYSVAAAGSDGSAYLLLQPDTATSHYPLVYIDTLIKINSSGTIVWKRQIIPQPIALVYPNPAGTGIYLAIEPRDGKDSVLFINDDGSVRWSVLLDGYPYKTVVDSSGFFYQNTDTSLVKYDTAGNRLYAAPLPAFPSLHNVDQYYFDSKSLLIGADGNLWLALDVNTHIVKKKGTDYSDEYDWYKYVTILNPKTGLPVNARKPWITVIKKEIMNLDVVKGQKHTYFAEEGLFGELQMSGNRLIIALSDYVLDTEIQTPGKDFQNYKSLIRMLIVNANGKVKQFTHAGKGIDECKSSTSHTISNGDNTIQTFYNGAGNIVYLDAITSSGKAKCGTPALKKNEFLALLDPATVKATWTAGLTHYDNGFDGVWSGTQSFKLNSGLYIQSNAALTSFRQYTASGSPGTVTLTFPYHPARMELYSRGDDIYMNQYIGSDTIFVKYTTAALKARSSSLELGNHPKEFSLHQNYPNPFNPSTKISFTLPVDATVSLTVYNLLGQKITTALDKEEMNAGDQEIEFNAADLPSGVYFYRLTAEGKSGNGQVYSDFKKMILIK